ncbi:MAG: helix-turn-helix transcriptional regulator [Oscillospiraceae bacterium]
MIELTELKLVTASNIINQRTKAGMTQAELGAKLNYSDKSVSKWERGEAIPDAYVLSEMAELFGVTVDISCPRTTAGSRRKRRSPRRKRRSTAWI